MRKVFLSLLLATVAASPALAQDNNSDQRPTKAERQQARSERQSAREDSRPARPERQSAPRSNDRQSAPNFAPQSNRFVRQQAPQAPDNYAGRFEQRQQVRDNRVQQQQLRQSQIRDVREGRQDLREQRQDLREQRQDLRQQIASRRS